jgi:hypothetical protein
MSSRDYTKHLVSNTSPTNAKVGDEYYDPITNKLYKKLAVNGTTVRDTEVLTVSTTGDVSGTSVTSQQGMFLNNSSITQSYTIPIGYNAMSVGTIIIANGATVTIPNSSRWVII